MRADRTENHWGPMSRQLYRRYQANRSSGRVPVRGEGARAAYFDPICVKSPVSAVVTHALKML